MEVKFGPNSAEEPNLLYQLQRKIKVFNTNNPLSCRGYNLITSTSKYGIVFIASPMNVNGILSVYHLKDLIDKESEPPHVLVELQMSPTHIAVNCNQEWLAVIGGQMLLVYKCVDFQNPEVRPSVSIKCDVNPSTFVSSLQWNPCIPDTIGIVYFDGTLSVSQVSNMQVKKIQSNARCLCWSPKGKQLVTGNNDGTLTQYKPDLSQMKMVPTPNLFEGAPVEVLSIYWIATYQFAVAYRNASDNSRPAVTIINTPKGGAPSCINYDDICYSTGSDRPWFYYLQGIAQWNIILTSSANSMEIATLATTDGANWMQWCQSDEARPELPLTNKTQENFPVGICVDTAAVHQIPWGENEVLPPMPILHVISNTGWLTIFNIINLNKSAPQLCSPIQPLMLPNAAFTKSIPDDVPAQQPMPTAPQPMPAAPQPTPAASHPTPATPQQPKQQPQLKVQPLQPQIQQAVQQPQVQSAMQPQAKPPMQPQPSVQQQPNAPPQLQPIATALTKPIPQVPSHVQPGIKKEPPTTTATAGPPTILVQPKVQKLESAEVTAALKLEQEKINKAKVNQELKKILIKEVNDFQMELYKFMRIMQDRQNKFHKDIQGANLTMEINMDVDMIRKECEMEELREIVIQLKLELVRTCAAVAEARTHAEVKGHQEWTQMDPLTAKRIASVKKLSYYVQNQLDQARKALDHKWNEMLAREEKTKPGERMIRPILDDVYQPLVKQQEILSRQQAVIKTLRNTMNECNITPSFKSTSLLRNTPFKNKDPLSKLTKNILNMSIEPQNKAKEQLLNSQKLDALRDILSNHKPIKIKPVSVEVTQHLENMKKKYEQSVKERELIEKQIANNAEEIIMSEMEQKIKAEPVPKPQLPSFPQMQMENGKVITPRFNQVVPQITSSLVKNDGNTFKPPVPAQTAFTFAQPPVPEAKPDIVKESPIPTPTFFKPAAPVARTLFTDEPNDEKQTETKPKSIQNIQQVPAEPKMTASQNTKSLLRQYILKESNGNLIENKDKNDPNTFMGQNICTPTAFAISKPQAAATPSAVFASKPIADMANMFSQFQTSPVKSIVNPKSSETGEPEAGSIAKEKAKEEKPITNMFSLKTSQQTPLVSKNQNVPDIIKGGQVSVLGKVDSKPFSALKTDEVAEKLKENVPSKPIDNKKIGTDKKEDLKPTIVPLTGNVQTSQSVIVVDLKKPAAKAKIEKVPSSIFSGTPAAPPPTVAKPQQGFSAISTPSDTSTIPDSSTKAETTPKSAVFDQANVTSVTVTLPKPKEFDSIKADAQQENLSVKPIEATTPATISVESKPVETPASGATSNSSVFSSSTNETTQGLNWFGTQTSSSQSIFASTAQASTTSVFGTSAAQSLFSVAASKSLFGTSVTTTPSSVSSQNSVFGTSQSTPSQVFGTPTQGSIFATTTENQAPTFGQAQTTQASVFAAKTTQPSVFGTPTQTTQASVFGTPTQTTQASVFGAPTQTTQASVFGTPTQTTQASVFGTPTQTTQASVFGNKAPTTQASVFGIHAQSTQASVFGTPTQTSQTSVFGTPTQTSIFGTPTQTTQASVFGTQTATTQASVFGTQAPATQASVFGTPTQTTQASVFGTPTTTAQGSLFGGGESDLFASASISTTSASQTSGGSIFGGSPGSVFGSTNTNVFGGKANFTGANPAASSIFGGAATAAFGQKPANDFWSGGNSGSGFGQAGFGQQPTTQPSSIFGTSGGSFSTPNAQPFGSPQPFGENKPSVFGTPQQQSSAAFGGSPVFASKPVFGGSPSFGASGFGGFNKSPNTGFGAPATFGGGGGFGAPAFGNTSPGKMFGNTTPSFGSPTQSNSTFEALATQNTLTFGNLAQQTAQPAQPQPPSFNTSPSFTGWRG